MRELTHRDLELKCLYFDGKIGHYNLFLLEGFKRSTLVQVTQWPRSRSPHGITRPQWVNENWHFEWHSPTKGLHISPLSVCRCPRPYGFGPSRATMLTVKLYMFSSKAFFMLPVIVLPSSLWYKTHQIPTLKKFSYCLAAVFGESFEARC